MQRGQSSSCLRRDEAKQMRELRGDFVLSSLGKRSLRYQMHTGRSYV